MKTVITNHGGTNSVSRERYVYYWGFPGKESACNAGGTRDTLSIPGLRRSLGEGNFNPLHYSHQENPMNRGAWQATVLRAAKSQT